MAPLRNLTEDEVFLDLIDEMSPGVLKIQTPVSLRADADAHQFVIGAGLSAPISVHCRGAEAAPTLTMRRAPSRAAVLPRSPSGARST